ncbi:MAG: hypothetical protein H0X40_00335 [Chthoniobacterales bacterium]|nr:hypothetical protein [Chthoniobacterales bacterium]
MNERSRAEEDLRVIRNLMERATIYRAISAPTALVGGLLAVGTSVAFWLVDRSRAADAMTPDGRWFATIWLVVLALVLAVNALFVRQEARRGGRPFLSSGAKLALRAIAPCLLVPAAATIWFFRNPDPIDAEVLVSIWIAFYGLALLATALFAPRSLAVLGWAFLLSSLLVVFWPKPLGFDPRGMFPDFAMGATFGLYHLLYAACIWSRRRPKERGNSATE